MLVWHYSLSFHLSLRYDVYADLTTKADRLTLSDGGAGLQDMHADFTRLQVRSGRQADKTPQSEHPSHQLAHC